MRYYRCKCGKHEIVGSYGPYPCQGCEVCNTVPAVNDASLLTPLPHTYGEPEWKIDKATGERWQERRCLCGKTLREEPRNEKGAVKCPHPRCPVWFGDEAAFVKHVTTSHANEAEQASPYDAGYRHNRSQP